jgi:hypothetical protein
MTELIRMLAIAWLIALVLILLGSALVVLLGWRREPIERADRMICPICSREMNRDWIRPSGLCCDCDEEMEAIGRYDVRLTRLNPGLIWSAGRSDRRLSSNHETGAAACAGRRPAQCSDLTR